MLKQRKSNVQTGNAGEHLVMAQLLLRGFHAGLADRGNPAFDIFTRFDGRQCSVRVKTCTHKDTRVTWSAKSEEKIFLELGESDFVALVQIPEFDVTRSRYWIIPTKIVSETLRATHKKWLSIAKRDGSARKDTRLRGLYLKGEPSYNRGYYETWAKYENAWHLLTPAKTRAP